MNPYGPHYTPATEGHTIRYLRRLARLIMPPRTPVETAVQRHRREKREAREIAILKTIPPGLPGVLRRRCEWYARLVAANVSKRGLRRVVYPWTRRPLDPKKRPEARVKRGKLSNPTALA